MDLNIIHQPDHYIKGRSIQPIDLIEDWGLCHHLACVVKYIARCGRKQDAYQDLLKAQWYLRRELSRIVNQPICNDNLGNIHNIFLEAVLDDWQLPINLELALTYIKPSPMRIKKHPNLVQALKYLQQEIQTFEGRGDQ